MLAGPTLQPPLPSCVFVNLVQRGDTGVPIRGDSFDKAINETNGIPETDTEKLFPLNAHVGKVLVSFLLNVFNSAREAIVFNLKRFGNAGTGRKLLCSLMHILFGSVADLQKSGHCLIGQDINVTYGHGPNTSLKIKYLGTMTSGSNFAGRTVLRSSLIPSRLTAEYTDRPKSIDCWNS